MDMTERRADKEPTETLRKRLAKAQELVRKYVPPTTSLVDELIAERRDAARYE